MPDPISAARLSAYADMLALSPQQRHALNDLHAPYREEFQKLREGEIEGWLKSGGMIYTRKYLTTQRQLFDRIAAIDNRLFDSAVAMLTEEQVAKLPRIKAVRQRERAMAIKDAWPDQYGTPFDLSVAASELMLPPEQRQAIDATLASYEAAVTAKFERAIDDRFACFTKAFDAFIAAGLTDEKRIDEANADAVVAISKPIWNEWTVEQRAAMKAIIELNRRTLAAMKPLLPMPTWRLLHNAFISRSYSTTIYGNSFDALVKIETPQAKALARDNLTDEQRAVLESHAAEFETELQRTIEAMIVKVEQYRDAFVIDYDHMEEYKARSALKDAISETWQAMRTRVSEDSDRITALIGPEPAPVEEIPDPETGDFTKVSHHVLMFGRWGVTSWLPPPIGWREAGVYTQWLGLNDAEIEAMRQAHDRYVVAHADFEAKQKPIMRAIWDDLRIGDGVQGYTLANLRRQREAVVAAKSQQQAIEAQFFAELESSLVGGGNSEREAAAMQRIRCARQREWLNSGVVSSQIRQAGGRCDGLFDVERMLRRVRDLDLSEPAADRVLSEYEQAIVPLLEARQKAAMAFFHADDDLRAEWAVLRAKTGEDNPDMDAVYLQFGHKRLKNAARDAANPIAELNRVTIEKLAAALPADDAARVVRTFDRMSWPWIYYDRFHSAPLLAAALKRDDLTPQQRTNVENLAAEFHPAYDAIIERMKTMVEGPDSSIYDQQNSTDEAKLAYIHRASLRDAIVFERYELNMRAWQGLKGVLTEDQAKAIGMPATPPEPPQWHDQFGT